MRDNEEVRADNRTIESGEVSVVKLKDGIDRPDAETIRTSAQEG